jgi:putative endonuclease
MALTLDGGCTVYILLCSDGSYYVGSTRNEVETRVSEHNNGHHGGYTYRRRPVTLLWSNHFDSIIDAIAMERQIKGWAREKKEALIAGEFALLPDLSKAGVTRAKRWR